MEAFTGNCRSIEDCNRQYRLLWKKYRMKVNVPRNLSKYLKFWPQQYPAQKMRKKGILFISLNPAFNEGVKTLLTIKSTKDLDDPCIANCVVEEHRSALSPNEKGKLYTYYDELRKVAIKVKKDINWCNLDLISVRGSKQNEVINDLELNRPYNGTNKNLESFLQDNIEIVRRMIEIINPPVVVVVNGFIKEQVKKCSKNDSNREKCNLVKNLGIVNNKKFKGENELRIRFGKSCRPVILFKMLSGRARIKKEETDELVRKIKARIDMLEDC